VVISASVMMFTATLVAMVRKRQPNQQEKCHEEDSQELHFAKLVSLALLSVFIRNQQINLFTKDAHRNFNSEKV
jgi:hypothetical protein